MPEKAKNAATASSRLTPEETLFSLLTYLFLFGSVSIDKNI